MEEQLPIAQCSKTTDGPTPMSHSNADHPISAEQYTENLIHHVRWIHWKGRRVPVATQNENGPCPLLAVANLLLIRGDLTLPTDTEVVAATKLINMIGDLLIQRGIQQQQRAEKENYLNNEQNIYDAMTVLPRMSTGLDVNVKFSGVFQFEYTPECIVFDVLNIQLCHGWLCDPRDELTDAVINKLSYNQLVELIVVQELSRTEKGKLAAVFLASSASQLTDWGLTSLRDCLIEDQLAVFFRNNHFSIITKHQQRLYLLITDQGFLKEEHCVWETLDTIDGDSVFVDSNYCHVEPKAEPVQVELDDHKQIDNDYLLAMSLEKGQEYDLAVESDERMAVQMQEEEQRALAAQREREQSHAGASSPKASKVHVTSTSHASNFTSFSASSCELASSVTFPLPTSPPSPKITRGDRLP